jgi:hypothetical protein
MSKDYAHKLYLAGRSHGMGANRLWARALEEGAEINSQDPSQFAFNGPFSLSINHLAGLSFELLLKAAYVASGGPPEDKHLRDEIGHDLIRALDKAEELGFDTDVPHLREIIGYLRDPYRRHFFRYHWPDEFPLPEFKQVNDALAALEEDVKALCALEDGTWEEIEHK